MNSLENRAAERVTALRETMKVCPRSRLAAELNATITLIEDCLKALGLAPDAQRPPAGAPQVAGGLPTSLASASDTPR